MRGEWSVGRLPFRNGDGYAYGGEIVITTACGRSILLQSDDAELAGRIRALPDLEGRAERLAAHVRSFFKFEEPALCELMGDEYGEFMREVEAVEAALANKETMP